jgi:hydroxyethylthiazole kinase-like sugar kinase family protein
LIATFAAVLPDRAEAARAALTLLREASAEAGALAAGPGSFAASLIDRLAARAEAAEQSK